MSRVSIGDRFCSWEVIGRHNGKNLCRCFCGTEKSFTTSNLLQGNYGACSKCGHDGLTNLDEIKKYWNSDLNRTPFTNPKDFKLNKKYWFTCSSNHNFKAFLKSFDLKNCHLCNTYIENAEFKIEAFKFATELFSYIYNIKIDKNKYLIIIEEIKAVICFMEYNRFSDYKYYYPNDSTMLKSAGAFKELEKQYTEAGYNYINYECQNNFFKNVDNIKELVVSLIHTYSKS